MERKRLIRASEVGDYIYCRRSWWLRQVVGLTPGRRERLQQGTRLHRQHGRVTGASSALLWLGLAFIGAALLALWAL